MKVVFVTIDVMDMCTLAVALLLAITGRVDWWIFVLFFLSQIHLPISFHVGESGA